MNENSTSFLKSLTEEFDKVRSDYVIQDEELKTKNMENQSIEKQNNKIEDELNKYQSRVFAKYPNNSDNSLLLSQQIQELHLSMENLEEKANNSSRELEKAYELIFKLNKKRKKQKNIIQKLQFSYENEHKEKNELQSSLEKLNFEYNSLNDQLKDYQNQMAAAHSSYNNAKTAYLQLTTTSDNKSKALDQLQHQIDSQKNELQNAIKQRNLLLTLIHKFHILQLSQEKLISQQQQKNTLNNNNLKSNSNDFKSMINSSSETIDISKITFPFSNDLNDKCKSIFSKSQFTITQQIQLVLKEIFKNYEEIKHQNNNLKKQENECKNQADSFSNQLSLLYSIIQSFKTIINDEHYLNECAFVSPNNSLIKILSDACVEFQSMNIPKESQINLFDSEKCNQIIKDLPVDAKQLFESLISINMIVMGQLKRAKIGLNKNEEINQILSLFKCQNFDQLHSKLSSLKSQLNQYKHKTINLDRCCKNQKKDLSKLHMAYINGKKNSTKLEGVNMDLMKQLTEKDNQIQILNNNLFILQSKCSELTAKTIEHENQISDLKSEIDRSKKIQEQNLSTQLFQNKNRNSSQISEQILFQVKNQYERRIEELKGQLSQLQEEYSSLHFHHEKSIKKWKTKFKDLQNQFDKEISNSFTNEDHLKEQYSNSLARYNSQSNENQKLITKLSNSLNATEEKNQNLLKELTASQVKIHDLESRILSFSEEREKDKQIIQAKITAAVLKAEDQLNDKHITEIKKIENENQQFRNYIIESLTPFYNIHSFEVSNNDICLLMKNVANDLKSLEIFRQEALN